MYSRSAPSRTFCWQSCRVSCGAGGGGGGGPSAPVEAGARGVGHSRTAWRRGAATWGRPVSVLFRAEKGKRGALSPAAGGGAESERAPRGGHAKFARDLHSTGAAAARVHGAAARVHHAEVNDFLWGDSAER